MNFNNDVWYYPATYWFWHYVPSKDEIDRQIEDMKNKGIMSFQIAVRLNMPLKDYLSNEYLNAYKLAASKAKSLGMIMGIYDDYNWQSGQAAGKTVEHHPELKECQLFWTKINLSNNIGTISNIYSADAECLLDVGKNWIYENGYPVWDDWKIISVVAVKKDLRKKFINLTQKTKVEARDDNCRLYLDIDKQEKEKLEEYEILAFVSARCKSSRIINYLLPESSKQFIKVNYELYREALGEYFGDTVQYIFYDQPHSCFYNWKEQFGNVKTSLMASDNLFKVLNKNGHLDKYLVSIAMDIGSETAKWRCGFFEIYSNMAIEAYFKPLADWCKKYNIKLSGHEVLSHVYSWSFTSKVITQDTRCNFGMDYFSIDKYRDITAVDAKNNYTQITAKMGDSVAISNGKSKCIVEQYYGCERENCHFGVGEWELTLADLRKQAIYHHLLGARQFLTHAYWLSNGKENNEEVFVNPRWDFAPGINFEPWFKHYRELAIQSKNLSKFLDCGNIEDDVVIFYPLRTFWAKGLVDEIGEHGATWAKYLMDLNYEYHIVDEMNLLDDYHKNFGETSVFKKLKYKAMIMPYCEVLYSEETVKAIEKLLSMGIKIIFTGKLPHQTQSNGEDTNVKELIKQIFAQYRNQIIYSEALPTKEFIEDNLAELKEKRIAFYKIEQETVWIKYTQAQGKIWFTIFNKNEIDINGYVCLPVDGKVYTVYEYDVDNDKYKFISNNHGFKIPVEIEPLAIKCLYIEEVSDIERYVLDDGWFFEGNNIARRKIDINKSWEMQDLETYSNLGTYTCNMNMISVDKKYKLILPKVYGAVSLSVNDIKIADKSWGKYEFIIPKEVWKKDGNRLKIEVTPSIANKYYNNTKFKPEKLLKMGIEGAPILIESK